MGGARIFARVSSQSFRFIFDEVASLAQKLDVRAFFENRSFRQKVKFNFKVKPFITKYML